MEAIITIDHDDDPERVADKFSSAMKAISLEAEDASNDNDVQIVYRVNNDKI